MQRLLAALSGLALFSGCATLKAPETSSAQASADAAFQLRRSQLQAAQGFELTGRIAVKGSPLSGNLRWQQQPQNFELRITGPFGAGALLLEGQGGSVRIRSKSVDLTTTEPDALLLEQTGWPLPLAALRHWVLGVPAPGVAAELQVDAEGRTVALQQLGWTLHYSDYGAGASALPGRLQAEREGQSATLIIQNLVLSP